MATRPELPEFRNPMLEEERAPSHEILIERRCLGQTELKVRPGQVGTSNATMPDNLGVLDYAHLRVPLPKDLSGSGIFLRGANRKWPEAYFLMRRSSDGFISATGMFKAAFPYAQSEEELVEKEYIKSLEAASSEEVAGNVWINPVQALELADEYGIRLWIAALLDTEPIAHGTSDPKKAIKSPPTFRLTGALTDTGRTPAKKTDGKRSARGPRGAKGGDSKTATAAADSKTSPPADESPVKASKTPRKMATPRKPRNNKTKTDDAVAANGERAADTVKVEVETTTVPTASGEEVEATKVNVEMPAGHPDLELPTDTDAMLAKARAMVREAQKIDGAHPSSTSSKAKGKRKVDDVEELDDDASAARPAKHARRLEIDLRKERIRRRALTGIVASLAIGALIPIASTALFGT